MTIAFPRLARAGAHSPEQPLNSAARHDLNDQQRAEVDALWGPLLRQLDDDKGDYTSHVIGHYLVRRIEDDSIGVMLAPDAVQDNDSWLAAALKDSLPTSEVIAYMDQSKLNFIQIKAESQPTSPSSRPYRKNVQRLGAGAGSYALAGLAHLVHTLR